LFFDAVECPGWYVFAGLTGKGNDSGLDWMSEVLVAATLSNLFPSVVFDHPLQIPEFQRISLLRSPLQFR
jgi:hypothetical protein